MNDSGEDLLIERDGPVTSLIINRPEARNACTVETVRALYRAIRDFEADEAARVGVLTSVGPDFCAGADLKELAGGAAIGFTWAGEDEGPTRRAPNKPVIAAVEGHAVAAGLALAVWCDLRVADDTAIFGVYCRRFGGPMPNGTTVRLPRLIGQSRALDMMLTGRGVDAREAAEIGLVNRLVPRGEARRAAAALAHELAQLPQTAMLSDRESLLRQWDFDEETAIRLEIELAQPAFREGFQRGAQSFVDGRGRHGSFED
ncbi:MAG: crotonase/enoyl-CoA hydratase family protein [Alphaproteobacteria bacterium]|jgi:enoyl-CoA hydratase|nr:crotonase/enoyl-CoA hydratase family protein [Alphaproteobacteria bacterium]MDP6812631.1 crotonase/enoyl-CoA hydratase family protein [Alphaproteobacteria bacterium]